MDASRSAKSQSFKLSIFSSPTLPWHRARLYGAPLDWGGHWGAFVPLPLEDDVLVRAVRVAVVDHDEALPFAHAGVAEFAALLPL